ncbi:MAG: shufflon system plasmid conjugative transfer pilus tip adhesin PilV [Betaproteobacteria bacterium]|nr:shufflon system plasmid conjugative transfer pilus tip adhesin PilV [Betaproteobacteria bacterium]
MGEIVGVLIAALVAMFGVKTYSDYQVQSNNNLLAATTASQWTQISTAATSYIQTNAVAIQAVATATTPAIITIGMLQTPEVSLLPASFTSTNPYQQTWQIEVLQPTAGNLQALIMTIGGTALPDKQAANIANLMGATGGFIPKNDTGLYVTNTAYGTAGSWQVPTTSYINATPGELAALLYFNNGQLQSPYLYRNAIPGQPQLNAMNTPLIMNSVQTATQACATNGAIAQDGNGVVLSCQSGAWQQQGSAYWRDPVANFASLPVCNTTSAWQTRIAQMSSVGVGPRAYTCNGTSWQPLSLDDGGNLTVAGTLAVGQLSTNTLQLNGVATAGTWCGSKGSQARDAAGMVLSCVNGVWRYPNPLAEIAGKSASCGFRDGNGNYHQANATVTTGLQPYTAYSVSGNRGCATGWVAGTAATACWQGQAYWSDIGSMPPLLYISSPFGYCSTNSWW